MRVKFVVSMLFSSLIAGTPAGAQNVVTDWSRHVEDVLTSGRPAGSAEVLLGMVHIAMYDAVVSIEGGFSPFATAAAVTYPASVDAAVATAAWRVGRARITAAQQAILDDRYSTYLAGLPNDAARLNGIDVGEQVATALLALRASDGFDRLVEYVQPPQAPGVWEPTAASAPVDVKLRQVTPLTFADPSAFRPDGPQPLASLEYAADFNEVKMLGRADSVKRSFDQTGIARFWSENTAVQWNRTLRTLAVDGALDIGQSARMLAMTHTASADAVIACFEAKYYFLSWRPLHAIQRADTDGNPGTDADPTWTALLNVNHPEYPSGHACWSGAVLAALEAYFGTDRMPFSAEWRVNGVVQAQRHYESFRQALKEVIDARVYAGLHFRNTMMEGARLGRMIARHVTRQFFRAVD